MKLPYQRYSELSFDEVHAEICEFHGKQQYGLLSQIKNRAQLLMDIAPDRLSEFIGKEIEFWPGIPGEVTLPNPKRETAELVRQCSKLHLSDSESIEFSTICQFVSDALTRSEVQEHSFFHRPYPSGGGLYPAEVFMCRTSDNVRGWPDSHRVFHLKANSRELESMKAIVSVDDLRQSLSGFDAEVGRPYFALVYCVYLDKVVFKYKYRGYRTALMEVGSMYQLCDLYSKMYGLRNRLWAGFYDGLIGECLNINTAAMLPCVVQFFGR